jgi:hypothetical protein
MLMPLSVGGWGWREAAAAALFPLAEASAGAGVAAGLAYGAVLLVASLPGLAWPFVPGNRDRRLPRRPERPDPPERSNMIGRRT